MIIVMAVVMTNEIHAYEEYGGVKKGQHSSSVCSLFNSRDYLNNVEDAIKT
tara:strand:- start:197 stop:349 length:153 start_codon:yes stop_codon:yes gene_type:complete